MSIQVEVVMKISASFICEHAFTWHFRLSDISGITVKTRMRRPYMGLFREMWTARLGLLCIVITPLPFLAIRAVLGLAPILV
jgi:hypothetical protein